MRTRRIAWTVGGCALVTFAALAACTSDSAQVENTPPDAGNANDVAAPAVDAAGSADAGGGGTDADADADAAKQPGPATFTVIESGAPKAGIFVLVSDAAGSTIASLVTDATGKVTYVVPVSGVTMTAFHGQTSNVKYAMTVVDVMPGDAIVHRYSFAPSAGNSRPVSVATPPNPPVGTTKLRVFAGSMDEACMVEAASTGSTGQSVLVNVADFCAYDGKTTIVVQALDATNAVIGQAWRRGLFLDPAQNPIITIVSSGWVGLDTYNLNVVAPALPQHTIEIGMAPYAENIQLRDYERSKGSVVPDGGAQGITPIVSPAGLVDAIQYNAGLYQALGNDDYSKVEITRRTAPSFIATIDFKDALPPVSSATLDTTDVTRPKMSWALTAQNAATMATVADAVTTVISWQEGNAYGRWSFYAPPSVTSVQIPVVPATVDAWKPKPGVAFGRAGVNFIETDRSAGYHDFIKNVSPQYIGFSIESSPEDMYANETLRTSSFGQGYP